MKKENKEFSPEFLAFWKSLQDRKRQKFNFNNSDSELERKYEEKYQKFDQEEWGGFK